MEALLKVRHERDLLEQQQQVDNAPTLFTLLLCLI